MTNKQESIPCINCITFGLCKASYEVSPEHTVITLSFKCSLLDEYLSEETINVSLSSVGDIELTKHSKQIDNINKVFNWGNHE